MWSTFQSLQRARAAGWLGLGLGTQAAQPHRGRRSPSPVPAPQGARATLTGSCCPLRLWRPAWSCCPCCVPSGLSTESCPGAKLGPHRRCAGRPVLKAVWRRDPVPSWLPSCWPTLATEMGTEVVPGLRATVPPLNFQPAAFPSLLGEVGPELGAYVLNCIPTFLVFETGSLCYPHIP